MLSRGIFSLFLLTSLIATSVARADEILNIPANQPKNLNMPGVAQSFGPSSANITGALPAFTGPQHTPAPPPVATYHRPTVLPYGVAPNVCPGGTVSICGVPVSAPIAPVGASATLAVPAPYVHETFTIQCQSFNSIPSYLITSTVGVTCTLQACPASTVKVCSADIPVPAGTKIGGTVTVDVPPTALSAPSPYVHPSFTAQCVEASDGSAVYEVTNAKNASCNLFPCPDSTVRLCNANIPVAGGTPLGSVVEMKMPAPFAPDAFTVQCLASGDHAPVYQTLDAEQVTCDKMQ